MGHIDQESLAATLQHLDELGPGAGIVETLARLNDGVVAVFGMAGAGQMYLDEAAVSRFVVASDDTARTLEVSQEELGQGPCVDALVHDRTVTVSDFTTDERWPALSEIVVPRGIVSMVGIPIRVGGGAVGSVNVYRSEAHTWDDTEVAALSAFCSLIESALANALLTERHERLIGQLQQALDNRVVIERAVGLLMGRNGYDAVAGFNELRSLARRTRRKVRDVAAELVGETTSDGPGAGTAGEPG